MKEKTQLIRRAHLLIRLRLLGWILIGTWQLLSLISEFVPLVDVESKPIRVAGKVSGLLGLIIIAYGFEQFAEVSHRIAQLHD